MSPDRSHNVERLYRDALRREPSDRAAFLRETCAGDELLQRDVESLLAGVTLAGRQIGPYQVLSLLGAGGMGEVYRARDARLGREVAIKVLPAAFASDPERLNRFRREARLLAALNHPHIAAIYGFEEAEGQLGLVLELVEGSTLADRVEIGPLPLGEALQIASQIALALEAAHAKGIVHRDLKPANIKVTPAGVVKILDFGLAKIRAPESAGVDLSQAPTMTATGTIDGMLIGTARYMSPEQARAKPMDKRTDVWAFGCVLFEMLAGTPVFEGDTLSDTIARILEREPEWQRLPRSTPARVRELLRRCLQKDHEKRLDNLADARKDIDVCLASPFKAPLAILESLRWSVSRPPVRWTLAALAVLAASITLYQRRDRDAPLPQLANPTQVTNAVGVEDYPTLSPDGSTLAYQSNQSGDWDIWMTQIGGGAPVNRTHEFGGEDIYPSWSPDGRQVAFWSNRPDGRGYFVMPALGGPPVKLLASPFGTDLYHSPAEWSPDGTQIAVVTLEPEGTRFAASLELVTVATHESRRLKIPGLQESRIDLSWSHDGRYLAYLDIAQQIAETSQLRVLRLADGQSFELSDASLNIRSPRWSADDRSIYFVSNQASTWDLWRQNLDEEKRPRGAKERVTTGVDILHARFSADGRRLVYAKGRWVANAWRVPILSDRPATWADARQLTFDQAFIEFVQVSRDGNWIAFSSDRMGNQDLWKMRSDGGDPIRLTSDSALEWAPYWSPDGRQLSFYSNRTGNREIWTMPSDGGAARQLTSTNTSLNAGGEWSPDGKYVAYRSERRGSSDIWITSVETGQSRLITDNPAAEYGHSWSPDGKWLAFTSNRNGPRQLWRTLVDGGRTEQLTELEAGSPIWSRDGKDIFYAGRGTRGANFWAISPDTRKERRITDFTGRRGELNFQPSSTDGKYIYFTWREDLGDIWVMDVVSPTP